LKRVTAFLLVLALLFCAAPAALAGNAGTVTDPLASLSYITDTFIPTLLSEFKASVASKLGTVHDEAEAKLDSAYDSAVMRLGAPGYTLSDSFTAIDLENGGTVSMLTGGMFTLTSGTAKVTVTKGTVINISTGEEVPSGTALTPYQRYFCAEDTEAVFTASGNASCLVDGYYSTKSTVPPISTSFSDVQEGVWFYNAVHYCVNTGLFEGMGDGTFAPASNMNMAQLLQILYRMAGGDTSNSSPYWYSAAFDWSVRAGLITEAEFSPTANVTREYFIKMFYACASYIGRYDMSPRADITSATDFDKIDSSNYDAISWAVATGIIVGTDSSSLTIDPDVHVNRATVCQMIMRYLTNL